MCVCTLSYPKCKAHALYYTVTCGVFDSTTVLHMISQTALFSGKRFIEHKMCVSVFSTTFVWNVSHSKKNSARYYHKYRKVFVWRVGYSYQIVMKLEFPRYIFEKCSNIYIYIFKFAQWEASSSMRTNGRADMTKLIVAFQNFCERAKKCGMLCEKKNIYIFIEVIFEIWYNEELHIASWDTMRCLCTADRDFS